MCYTSGTRSMIYRVKLPSPNASLNVRSLAEFELIYTIVNPQLGSTNFIRAFDYARRLVVLSYADRVVIIRWPDRTLDGSDSSEARMTLSMQSDDLEELVRTQVSTPCLLHCFLLPTVEWGNTCPHRGPVCRNIQNEIYRGISPCFPILARLQLPLSSSPITDTPLSWNHFQGDFLLRRLLFYVVSRRPTRPIPETHFLWE